jgi:hypothetical protein
VKCKAISIIAELSGISSPGFCVGILQAGLIEQVSHLAKLVLSSQPTEDSLSMSNLDKLLEKSLFALSNIIAEPDQNVIMILLDTRVYSDTLFPLLFSKTSDSVRQEVAFCIGNLFLH